MPVLPRGQQCTDPALCVASCPPSLERCLCSRQHPANRDSRQRLSVIRTAQNAVSPGKTAFRPTRLPALIFMWFGPEISPPTQTAPLVPVARRTNLRWGAGCSAAEVLYLPCAEQQPRTTSAQALGLLNFCLVNTTIAFRAHQYKPSPPPHHNVANFQRRVISFETAHRLTAFYKYTFFSSSFRTLSPRALVHRIPTMAGGKGKSSGGKSSGGKTSGVDGSKKQQSHSARAGLQVREGVDKPFHKHSLSRHQAHLSCLLGSAPRRRARPYIPQQGRVSPRTQICPPSLSIQLQPCLRATPRQTRQLLHTRRRLGSPALDFRIRRVPHCLPAPFLSRNRR